MNPLSQLNIMVCQKVDDLEYTLICAEGTINSLYSCGSGLWALEAYDVKIPELITRLRDQPLDHDHSLWDILADYPLYRQEFEAPGDVIDSVGFLRRSKPFTAVIGNVIFGLKDNLVHGHLFSDEFFDSLRKAEQQEWHTAQSWISEKGGDCKESDFYYDRSKEFWDFYSLFTGYIENFPVLKCS